MRPEAATRELTVRLAQAEGLPLEEQRIPAVSEALRRLLELSASLHELPLENVEPAVGYPEWR